MRKKLTVMLLVGVMCLSGVTLALAVEYNEAPMLRIKVAAGELPPVEERLPEEPRVVGPGTLVPEKNLDFEIGEYGGIIRAASFDPGWSDTIFQMQIEPLLAVPGIGVESQRPTGNILKDYAVSEDGKVFTFYMRKGLKWSDGVPVTTEDIRFAYEDFLLNEELTPFFPVWLRSGSRRDGEPGKLEVIDDYTFRISFTEVYKGFPFRMSIAAWMSYQELLKPKHYLKQFHPRYTSTEKLESLIKEEELAKGEWWTLFNQKDFGRWEAADREILGFPVLTPWVLVKRTPQIMTYERNPYYFKVDAEGNQLPYIDGARSELVSNVEMLLMKILVGEVDFEPEWVTLKDVSLVKEQEEKGGYRVILGTDYHMFATNIWFNFTHPDPVWREVVSDVRFRKALNMAIDFEEILGALYYGFGETPPTAVPYNPKAANQLLDEIGLDKRDKEGWRLGPDGKRFIIPFEHGGKAKDITSSMELLREYFRKIGIETTVKRLERAAYHSRMAANRVKASVGWNHQPVWGGPWDDFLPGREWGWQWDRWYKTGGEKGEEPPLEVKRLYEISEQVKAVEAGGQEYGELLDELANLMDENLFLLPLIGKTKHIMIANKRLGNVPHKGQALAAAFAVEQFFFRR